MFNHLRKFLTVDESKPELAVAQFLAFSKQVPLLYLILVASTVALSISHADTAPWYLTLGFPMILCGACLFRLVGWFLQFSRSVTPALAIKRLQGTIRLSFVLGIAFTAWAFSLYGHGDALADAHVAFYMAITIVGCVFCLMHLRAAAVILVVVVMLPFTVFFAATGELVFQAIAFNLLLVAAALIYIVNIYYNDFATLIASRKELIRRQAETQRLSDENLRLANLDSLTQLSNRRWFFAALESALERAKDSGRQLAVGVIDLDGFKPVNDAYGHAAGDKLLVEVARRLEAVGGDAMRIARLGGDEFGFIIADPLSDTEVVAAATALIEALGDIYRLPGITARIGASAGVALFSNNGMAAEALFESADHALYHAKQTGRGKAVLFTAELATEIAYRSVVEQELKRGSLESELTTVFQPQWSDTEQRISGVEALARWNSSVLGPVRPDVFVPIAERCGMIGKLSEMLFAKALSEVMLLPDHVRLSFNLSAKDIDSAKTIDALLGILAASSFPPERLVFELTETAFMGNKTEALANIERIRAMGIGVAVDDFGVGYSNLSQVHRLPITEIKVDAGFVVDVKTNRTSRNVVRTILDLARNLGCGCIVEGVETEEQAAILRLLGCNMMQGYHFGRPAPVDSLLSRFSEEAAADPRRRAVAS